MCTVTFMSYWKSENAAEQIRNDAKLDAELNDGVRVNIKNFEFNFFLDRKTRN